MADVRTLADTLHDRLLAASPFSASGLGLREFDAEVPDATVEGEAKLRGFVEGVLDQARAIDEHALTLPDRITRGVVIDTAERTLLGLDCQDADHAVSPLPVFGPPAFMAVAARTVIADAQAAEDYVTRLRRTGAWLDQTSDRLRDGAARGRLPVAALSEQAVAWADATLVQTVPGALSAPEPPEGWVGTAAWRDQVAAAATEVVVPALARWRELIADELRPRARDDAHAGLMHLPGGEADYERAIRIHTTLPLTADELHRIGLDTVAELEAEARELGARIGHSGDLISLWSTMRERAAEVAPEAAMEAARIAVRRAESRAAEVFPAPLPAPCEIEPMPLTVGESGMAPHYTPPRLDGTRPGTYWFNTVRTTAGTGWDLETVAFHEAVPGHHLQLSRVQLLDHLPRMQQQRFITVHAEGWGLYAEQLAGEMGLHSSDEQRLGVISASLMRACRLVIDTGLHAQGWGREQARAWYVQHCPMPEEFLRAEIDRYLIWPGQALAYLTGLREINRLRASAQASLGDRFDLKGFHVAVLDHGSVPMPVLAESVDGWVASLAA